MAERTAERATTGRPSDSYRRTEVRPDRNAAAEENAPAAESEPREAREPRAPREERREPRTVEIVEVTSPKLYVGNLSFDAAESDLFDLFNGVGKVRNAEVVSNNYTQKSKGFAFVTMESIDEAKRAVVELHDKEFMGRKLLVSGAKTTERSSA
ncbi:MAG TPA: RNA-binding protein [Chthoniobacterales bacterium]|jgi:RNA recognition motif-containing protein